MTQLPQRLNLFALSLMGALATTCVLAPQSFASEGSVSGPVANTKVTEPYVRMMAREAYFWGWPMANIFNRRQAFKDLLNLA